MAVKNRKRASGTRKADGTPKNSYKIDSFRQASKELRILDKRSYARIEQLIPQLCAAGLKPDMSVLEVGSGTGTRSLEIARYLKTGKVTGIDVSDKLLAFARRKIRANGLKNVELERMNLYDRTLPANSFDFIYLRLVIQHLPDPLKAVEILHAALKPGGIIFIEDTDRDWLTIFPDTGEWREIYEEAKALQIERGGDSRCGRKLAGILEKTKFKRVQVNLIPVTGTGRVFDDWIDNYAPSFFNYGDEKHQKRAGEVLSRLKKLHKAENIHMYQIWFQAWGRK